VQIDETRRDDQAGCIEATGAGGIQVGSDHRDASIFKQDVAEAVVERFPVERVRVRVRKPEVELTAPVEFTAATAERSRR